MTEHPKGRLPVGLSFTELVRKELGAKLQSLCRVNPTTGCWEWLGYCNRDGYGIFGVSHQSARLAHRLSYACFRRAVPAGCCVLHICDNPKCINPAHLFLGSQAENVADCTAKGRWARSRPSQRGELNAQAKLKRCDVEAIRELANQGIPQRRIARRYGISQSQVSNIRRGAKWA